MQFLQAFLLAIFVANVSAQWEWHFQFIQQPQQQWPPQQHRLMLPQWESQRLPPWQQHWLRLPQWESQRLPQWELQRLLQRQQHWLRLPQWQQQWLQLPQWQQPQQEPKSYVLKVDESSEKCICQQPQQSQPQQQPQQPQPQQTQQPQPQQTQQPQPQQPQQPQPQQQQQPQPQQQQQPEETQQQPEESQQQPQQEGKPYVPEIDQNCLDCICQASTSCNMTLKCHNKGTHGYFCGPYWISWAYWYDAGRHGNTGKPEDFETCLIDKECSEKTIRGYMLRYGRDCDGSGTIDCADFARIHKMGFKQCGSDSLIDTPYWHKIQLCIKNDQSNDEIEVDGRNQEV
ncbi:uncharacterized protein NPIL_473281 [Nephila pilipes]|uniref:lysozyme n=1 Tax=Nephila pilipes TaxID=299642 RepID=A0A8X6N1N4_NEPPI|nr:uncharacterized protein NPIL_473281 [Nephila pilipes]